MTADTITAIKKALEDVTHDDAIGFINTAMRNWSHVPKLDADDLLDLAEELQRFSERRYTPTLESLQRENEALKEENGSLLDENSDLRNEPWPEWAKAVLKVIRSHTGYDGYDDAIEGVDMPLELEEHLSELRKKADDRENELVAMLNSSDESRVAQIKRAEAAEVEVARLQAEIDRKSSMPGDHRYWEGRYRDEAAENEKLRGALTPFAKFDLSELKQRAFLQILVCPKGDDHADNYGPHFHRARTALASTGGEHNAE